MKLEPVEQLVAQLGGIVDWSVAQSEACARGSERAPDREAMSAYLLGRSHATKVVASMVEAALVNFQEKEGK